MIRNYKKNLVSKPVMRLCMYMDGNKRSLYHAINWVQIKLSGVLSKRTKRTM
jgi:hypothetical protein